MKTLLTLLLSLLIYLPLQAQTPVIRPSGNTNDVFVNKGSYKADKLLVLPRTFTPFPSYDSTGCIWFDSAGTKTVWFHNGTSRVQVGSGSGTDSLQGLQSVLNKSNTAIGKPIKLNNGIIENYLDHSGFDVYLLNPTTVTGFGGISAGLPMDFNGKYYPRFRFTDSTGYSGDIHTKRLTDQREWNFRDKTGDIAFTNDSTIFVPWHALDTTRAALLASIAAKLNVSDTAAMLQAYRLAINGLRTDLNALDVVVGNKIDISEKAAPGGVATLDGSGLIPTDQISTIFINHTYTVSSTEQMLMLDANVGDMAMNLTDTTNFILPALPWYRCSIYLLRPRRYCQRLMRHCPYSH